MGVKTIRIHPAIGIARLGNSQDGFFIGPELPGFYEVPRGGYRDPQRLLKRQAARFHLYAYDGNKFLGEITRGSDHVEHIEWEVCLRNTKAAGRRFEGVLNPSAELRNKNFRPRRKLVLAPKPAVIKPGDKDQECSCTEFMGVWFRPSLRLATLKVDEQGHLLVLGGQGRSGTLVDASLRETRANGNDFANHDGWYDDVSDGSVRAVITMTNGKTIEAMPAWVVVAPPKYAPELQSVVTLYDTLYQVALDGQLLPNPFLDPLYRPSYNRDIYPILRRSLQMRWVFARAAVGHDFEADLHSRGLESSLRKHIFRQFRVPSSSPAKPGTGTGMMPYVWSDLYTSYPANASLTRHQYSVMHAWSEGRFVNDWTGQQPAPTTQITPEGLDRAALEACVGAAFFPGIECSFHMRDKFGYVEPFRLDPASLKPGDVTQQMSLPWQTDFVDCNDEAPFVWWPAQRPVDVLDPAKNQLRRWARRFDSKSQDDMPAHKMITDWYRLGLIKRKGSRFVEYSRVNHKPSR
jgi:L-Lysine epsilon oxidase N-terminal/L-lysine epsilon oxidase C-terminal domain